MLLLETKNIQKKYKSGRGEFEALKGISLTINEGEIVGLLGVNGAGKSTLSNIIVTLHPPTSGDIFFRGKSIYENVPEFRMNIGFCPQNQNLNPQLTVQQNLYYTALAYRMNHVAAVQRTDELITDFELSRYADAMPMTLSGGYKQRVLLARTLVHKPALIILDEPTVGLDPHVRHQLWDYMRMLRNSGTSFLLTTHYIEEAEQLSDRVCVLDKGVIKLTGTPEALKTDYAKHTLESVFIELTKEQKDIV
jgi:ABC-2 type transport system ATP-binding protein